jgi:hypothetical protein
MSCSFIAVLSFNHNSFNYGFKTILQDLFVSPDLEAYAEVKWNTDWLLLDLFYVTLSRFGIVFAFLTSLVPSGLFTPGL